MKVQVNLIVIKKPRKHLNN